MKIEFDHIEGWGKITQHDLIHAPCWVVREWESHDQMLEAGFLPWAGKWFPARSVRYDLERMTFGRTVEKSFRKAIKTVSWHEEKPNEDDYGRIVSGYLAHHQFDSGHVFAELAENREFSWLTYKADGRAVAFLAYLSYPRSFVGLQFAWDYADPKLSLGSVSTYVEATLARSNGCRWYYVMGGYENASLYKSNHEGFQFWTGKEWSEDKELYIQLCQRDSRITYENVYS
jgi:hypothetical protein